MTIYDQLFNRIYLDGTTAFVFIFFLCIAQNQAKFLWDAICNLITSKKTKKKVANNLIMKTFNTISKFVDNNWTAKKYMDESKWKRLQTIATAECWRQCWRPAAITFSGCNKPKSRFLFIVATLFLSLSLCLSLSLSGAVRTLNHQNRWNERKEEEWKKEKKKKTTIRHKYSKVFW